MNSGGNSRGKEFGTHASIKQYCNFEGPTPPTRVQLPVRMEGVWFVPVVISALIEVPSLAAKTSAEAVIFAREAARDLTLKVALSGVPLKAAFFPLYAALCGAGGLGLSDILPCISPFL